MALVTRTPVHQPVVLAVDCEEPRAGGCLLLNYNEVMLELGTLKSTQKPLRGNRVEVGT